MMPSILKKFYGQRRAITTPAPLPEAQRLEERFIARNYFLRSFTLSLLMQRVALSIFTPVDVPEITRLFLIRTVSILATRQPLSRSRP